MINRNSLCCVLLCLLKVFCAYADDDNQNFGYNYIPGELLKDADAVIRNYHLSINIQSSTDVAVNEYYAITILNSDGYNDAVLKEDYSKFKTIDDIEATLYDKDGDKIRHLKKKDITDYADAEEITDERVKSVDFKYAVYPFTVVFEIKSHLNNTFSIPDWLPRPEPHCSIEKADFYCSCPKDMILRYKQINLAIKPEEKVTDDAKNTSYSLQDIPVASEEDMEPPSLALLRVMVKTDDFSLAGMPGKMDTWQSLGRFFYDLNNNRDSLPPDIRKIVHAIADSCTTKAEKIALLYQYLQANTRYVSIQLGIGGWQCFKAAYVAQKGYGDCKALANYMKSLLKEAGIRSYAALVYAGADGNIEKMPEDFASNVFNHVILCVPEQKDTTWLECTGKDMPAGYLSGFTAGRNVLLLTGAGGVMVKTPEYSEKVNVLSRKIVLNISADNTLTGQGVFKNYGYFSDAEHRYFKDGSKENIENCLNNKMLLPAYQVSHYDIQNGQTGCIPQLTEDISFSGTGKITHTGKRFFVALNIIFTKAHQPENTGDRKTPFYINTSYQVNDTEFIKLDGAYSSEYIPKDKKIKYDFGEFECKVIFENNNTIKVTRHYMQKAGTYPKELFHDYVGFARAVNNEAAQNQVVLLKKE